MIDVCTRVIVKHTPVIDMRTGVIDMCTRVIDVCTGVIVKHTPVIGMYSSAIAVGGASTAGTEPPMLLQVGDKVAYRKGMTWVVDHSRHGGRQLSTRCTP